MIGKCDHCAKPSKVTVVSDGSKACKPCTMILKNMDTFINKVLTK